MIGAHALKRFIRASWPKMMPTTDGRTTSREVILAAPVYLLPPRTSSREVRTSEATVRQSILEGHFPFPHDVLIIETPAEKHPDDTAIDLLQRTYSEDDDGRISGCWVKGFLWKNRRLSDDENYNVCGWIEDGAFKVSTTVGRGADIGIERSERILTTVMDDLNFIADRGVHTETVRPSRIDRSRLAGLGVGPAGWEYHLVTLPPGWTHKTRVALGGTHASPRWHERRGHWRYYKHLGERRWVRACQVGDKKRGGVVKDYAIAAHNMNVDEGR